MSNEDKKRFLAAVTGLGGKIDGKAAAALIAAAASGGDAEIANKIIEKMMFGLGDEIDPSMMAALMATTALVARGASNEEVREYCLPYNHQTFLFELLFLALFGTGGDTFIPLSFLDQICQLIFFSKTVLEVKIDIYRVILTPFSAH